MRIAILVCGLAAFPALGQTVLFSNGPWMTGPTAMSLFPAPSGTQWSELAMDAVAPGVANKFFGFTVGSNDPAQPRIADDFVIPAGAIWTISQIRVLGFQTTTGTTSSISGVTVRIWNGPPNAGGQVIFGNETTNRLAQTSFAGAYRIFNSVVPNACGGSAPGTPQTNRPVMNVIADVGHTLGPGTYWIDVNLTGTLVSSVSMVPTTMPLQREPNPAANALRRSNGTWYPMVDDGVGCSPAVAKQDLFFEIIGTAGSGSCYANCDLSTATPVLNVADFGCFLSKFAGGNAYANCDGSTSPPILNVADFGCFLTKFAAGCS